MRRLWNYMWERPDDYRLITYLFLKGLALIYFAAFYSLAPQIEGLAGSKGILPLIDEQAALTQQYGIWRFFLSPSLFWLHASDSFLILVASAGILCSLMLFLGAFPRLMLISLYVLYLSLYHAGSLFMNFQWETLLLEAGFLAIFLAHGGSRLVIWLMRWLLFRLRFLSGMSKIISGDPTWAGFTALNTYFETQPLPHKGSWYAHQLPEWLLKVGTAGTLVVEILVPFLFLAPRRLRMIGAAITIVWQLLIIATSNHNFINLLTILLCLYLFDDDALRHAMPERMRNFGNNVLAELMYGESRIEKILLAFSASFIVVASSLQVFFMLTASSAPAWAGAIDNVARAYSVSNRYHVFPVMDTQRLELITEWSYDGQTWQPLEFEYKPGHPMRAPEFIVPHQPRLDWIMWFVPKGGAPFIYTYQRFLDRLREGSAPVVSLLPIDTFKHGPPKYFRAHIARYTFADATSIRETGRWWNIRYHSPMWLPPVPYKPW